MDGSASADARAVGTVTPADAIPRCHGPHCSQTPQAPTGPQPAPLVDGARQHGALVAEPRLDAATRTVGPIWADHLLAPQATRDAVFRPPCLAG